MNRKQYESEPNSGLIEIKINKCMGTFILVQEYFIFTTAVVKYHN